MEDIEDLLKGDFEVDLVTRNRKSVVPRVRKKKKEVKESEHKELNGHCLETFPSEYGVPEMYTIYIKTWGCSHNNSDSEYMAGQLASYGFRITDCKEEADVCLLNSCTVKNPAEDHFRNEIVSAQKNGQKLVLAGCVSQGAPRSEYLKGISIVGVQQIDRVVETVEETLKGNTVRFLGQKKVGGKKQGGASLMLPKVRRNPLIEIISINTGCLNQCTYCKTKHARGELGSYSIEEIVERAKQSFEEGVCEIWLTSEDTGAYGRDIGVTLPDLLWELVKVIPDNCLLRLGMTNPPYILDHLEEMALILQHPRVYSFLHVPVQSGSDNVLAEMKREYSIADFCRVVDTLREKVPDITIATDIICGFPTETIDDFQMTMELCKKYRFPSLFINQFYPRPGTPAAKMTRIPTKEVKSRSRELSEFFQSYNPYGHKLGERQFILITEEDKDGKHWVGHNKFYEQILIPKEKGLLGKMIEVEITETGKHFLKGSPLINTLRLPSLVVPLHTAAVSGRIGKKLFHDEALAAQEKYIILSFVLVITALLTKLFWLGIQYM